MHFPVKWANLLIPSSHILWSASTPLNLIQSIPMKSFRSLEFYFLTYFSYLRLESSHLDKHHCSCFRSLPILWSSFLDGILHAVCYSGWTWKGRSFSFVLRKRKAFDFLLISSQRNVHWRELSVKLAKFNKRNAGILCLEGTRRFK